MTIEKNKEFNEKLTALLKEYNVNIIPTMGIQLQDLPEVVNAEKVSEEVEPSEVSEEVK